MAKTVSSAINEFLKEIEPTESDREKIIKRHEYIRKTLRGKIRNDGRKPDFLSGSYARHTQIRPVNDVDIMVIFDQEEYWDRFKSNTNEFLSFVENLLQETYPNSEIRIQSHSIGIKFKEIPDVDIVPSFLIDFDKEIYLIPNYDNNIYVNTSPPTHQALISKHNKHLDQKFIPLIKLIKKWRDNNDVKFKSFHLEVFIMENVNKPFIKYQEALLTFFKSAKDEIFNDCIDPAGLSGNLAYYLTERQKEELSRFFTSISAHIEKLINLENEGKHQEAISGWRKIFSHPFPHPETISIGSGIKKKTTKFPRKGYSPRFGSV